VRLIRIYELFRRLILLQAESALSLVRKQEDPQAQISLATSPLEPFDVPDANLILRSSDLIDFRVHKSVLGMTSPFFKDLLSLSQPSDSETVDGVAVVRLSESSELLNSLVTILYPVRRVIPNSYEKVLYLLGNCR
jgi:BTB/POZ domain